jgi:Fe-S cluster assembly protein SufD
LISPNVAEAIETSGSVASRLHPVGSFRVDDHLLPTGREEVWRFTPLKRIAPLLQPTPTDDRPGDRAARVEVDAPEGVLVGSLAAGQVPRGAVLIPGDRAAASASAAVAEATHVLIPAGLEASAPVRIFVTGRGVERRANAHYVIEARANSRAIVVFQHAGSVQYNGNVEILVGDGASLTVVSIQDWAADAIHAGQHEARVGRDASYRHISVSLGGDVVRLHSNVSFEGQGGQAELFGLYFADAGQHLEHRLFVDHNQPRTHSNVDYRGALQGQGARSVWIGDVLIRKEAEGISTYESNKNLVLSDGCRADSVPNLEIETGEIEGAGHSSTTGRFDDEQLFYLRSRGISEEEARRLVVHGFFADIIRRIGVPEVEERMLSAIEKELEVSIGVPSAHGTDA